MSSKKPIAVSDDYIFEYELVEGIVFLHLQVFTWSKSKYVEYLKIFRHVLDILRLQRIDAVYILIDPEDKKLVKFEKMFGFHEFMETPYGLVMERSTDSGY